jgi:uncharacterized membrane protein YfcA
MELINGLDLGSLIVIFFCTAALSVITGSTSLITVPALLWFGVEPRTALATNMFALTIMSFGGALPFLRSGHVVRERLGLLIGLTIVGSIAGALLLVWISAKAVTGIVGVSMAGVALFSTFTKARKGGAIDATGPRSLPLGLGLTLALGVYGGFFSGGYVTMLTAVYAGFLGMSFLEAIATTKVINIFSSGVATAIFLAQGLVDVRLGLILGIAMFAGAYAGARIVPRLGELWARRLYLATVWLLTTKLLVYDSLQESKR